MGRQRKVKPEQAREHERRAWELRCRGWTQPRIARELGLDDSAVCRILKRVSARVLAELKDSVERVKAEQTETLQHVIDEALQAWERSKGTRKTVTRQTVSGGENDEDRQRTTQHASERTGDVAYLSEARAAMADLRKVWGVDAASRHEVSGPAGGAVPIVAIEVVRPAAGAEDGADGPGGGHA